MKERKVIYYRDEKNDEFSAAQIKARRIDGDYVYCPETPAKKFAHFFWYRIIAKPAIKCYLKIKFRHRLLRRQIQIKLK